MTICTVHPGGPKELPDEAFYESEHGKQRGRCKACRIRIAGELRQARREGKAPQQTRFVGKSKDVPAKLASEPAKIELRPGMIICTVHPGGPKELPMREFYATHQGRKRSQCIACQHRLRRERKPKSGGDTVVHLLEAPAPFPAAPPMPPEVVELSRNQAPPAPTKTFMERLAEDAPEPEPVSEPMQYPVAAPAPVVEARAPRPAVFKVGEYYISEQEFRLAHVAADHVTLYTSILEVDGRTGHPRNKRVSFGKADAPLEYSATLSWLDALAGSGESEPYGRLIVERETALEMASANEREAIALRKRVEELETKLSGVRALLNGVAPERIKA